MDEELELRDRLWSDVEKAVKAYVNGVSDDSDDIFVGDIVAAAHVQTMNGDRAYYYEVVIPFGMPVHHVKGLLNESIVSLDMEEDIEDS